MTRGFGFISALVAVLFMFYPIAHAHKPSDSYLRLSIDRERIAGQWDLALRDLEYAIGLDLNGDGNITWSELRSRHAAIADYVLPRLDVIADGAPCNRSITKHLVDYHTDGAYTVLRFGIECARAPAALTVTYRLFADLDPQHRGIMRLDYRGSARTAIFGPDHATQTFKLGVANTWTQFLTFVREGVWHIWIGLDHILFIIALLLLCVLYRERQGWHPAPRFRPALWNVLKIVTAFTLAHSITLSLAALGIINLPTRFVESAIAASIVIGALNNVYPLVLKRLWLVAFGFGLLHGFGFASVLADLELPRDALLLSLVGFNLGVEVGQVVIVAAFVPLAFLMRRTWMYRRLVLMGGSLTIALLASIWMAERVFNFKLLPV
ncbi:MAG: HupE/UreJ family protein [Gammaproteobacteria bacterium]|nr:HupE/UreJ family protein [Gammaproteobacteria bacterium]